MGQVNVNTPDGGTPVEPAGSSGAGMILGIIVAILVIAALVYFLVIVPGGTTTNGNGDGDTDGGTDVSVPAVPAPSSYRLVDLA